MDNNESRPLLHSFEDETWRSRARKRCTKIPSEITITGIILGLFLIVVTLLIVLENMESEKKEELTLDSDLLASPFKFNKKADDKSWQDKKDYMKVKNKQIETKNKQNQKWNSVNNGWKKFPDISGKVHSTSYEGKHPRYKPIAEDVTETPVIPEGGGDEYGKEIDDSFETFLNLQMSNPMVEAFGKEAEEALKLLHSGIKWKDVDDGWKQLAAQGWTELEIRKGLLEALKERKEEINKTGVLESPVNIEDTWSKIVDSWKKNMHKKIDGIEFPEINGIEEAKHQKDINDKYKDEMGILLSPKSSDEIFLKEDEGYQKLEDLGWKNKDIQEALFDAWEKRAKLLQSPFNVQSLFGKATDFFKKFIEKGSGNENSQKEINDEWAKKFDSILQSPKSSYEKWEEIDELRKKYFKDGTENQKSQKEINDKWVDEFDSILQSPKSSYGKWKKTDEIKKKHSKDGTDNQKSHKEINDEWMDKFNNILQSPKSSYEKWKKIDEIKKKHSKDGKDNEKSQKEINDEWAKDFESILLSPKSSYDKWKIFEEIKNHSKNVSKDKNADKSKNTNKGDDPIQESPMSFDDFMLEIIEKIKDHQKGIKEEEKQKSINDEWKDGMKALYSSQPTDKKWKEVDDHWKTIIEYERNSLIGKNEGGGTLAPKDHASPNSKYASYAKSENTDFGWKKLLEKGWKDQVVKEAVDKAWKDGDKLVKAAMGYSNMKWKNVNDGWKKISNKSIPLPTRCPISLFQRQVLLGSAMPSPRIDCALITEEVRREFGRCIDLSFLPKECKPSWREKCVTNYKYRKIDGTCNNKIHPTWGTSEQPFVRMIEPDYADGVSALRAAKDGGPLPNPRLLSRKLYSKRMRPDSDTSVLFMYFGLLVDHDLVETAVNSESIPCCSDDFIAHPETRPKECLQIDIPENDPFYGPKFVKCLNLVRSTPVNGVCGGRREQSNKATAYLDGSVVYGSTISSAKELRTFSTGQLRTQMINNTPFMAYAEGAGWKCGTPDEPLKCFEAGDSRVNMMVELTAMHTLWYREHNRIANELHKLNPGLRDELLYQEARKILVGELQHMTYNEFLPLLLGKKAMDIYDLNINKNANYDGYDETVDPTLFNVFGAAAFRVGHSLAPDVQFLLGPDNSTRSKVRLHETFFNTRILYHNGLDLLLRGAAVQRTQTVDTYITPEVRQHLFQPSGLDYGYDLAAVSVQRGRDHGLPSYTKWRSVCKLPPVKTFDDLYQFMDKDRVDMFKNAYKSVDDIDLIPGGLAEHHEDGSLVGPTYNCLIGRQFKKLRKGDRFWYEIKNEIQSFTADQLNEIYKSSMARIVCDNSDNINEIQRNPLKVPSSENTLINCSEVPKVNLSKWVSRF